MGRARAQHGSGGDVTGSRVRVAGGGGGWGGRGGGVGGVGWCCGCLPAGSAVFECLNKGDC